MSKRTSIASWLEGDELPDFYRLLGRRRLDPDIEGLTAAVKAAFGELLPYQNHADPRKARRAMSLLMELGRVESLLADPLRLAEANQRLTAELARQCAERFAAAGTHWKRPEVRAWLERDEQINSAALEETLAVVCAALPQPPAALKPVPVLPRAFAVSDTTPLAEGQVTLPPTPELDYVILDEGPLLVDHPSPTPACPHCGQRVPAQAAICVECGYDFRTGQRLATKTARPQQAARSTRPRPPAPPRNLQHVPAARSSHESSMPSVLIVAAACGVFFLFLVAGGLGLLAIRMRYGGAPSDQVTAVNASGADRGDFSPAPDSTTDQQDEPPERQDDAGQGTTDDTEQEPTNPALDSSLAKGKFDAAYRKAVLADADEFDDLWATALRLAPDAASRRRAHQTKIAALNQRPSPWPAETVEKLCAAYDLYLADAQSVDEKSALANSLLFVLAQKRALEAALARYAALNGEADENPLRETIVQRLTMECLNSISSLPVAERLAACERLVSLVKDDEATRLAAYGRLAGDAALLAQVPLEKLWEIFDVVLAGPGNGPPAANYLLILLDQVRRRGAQSEAAEHYENLARQGPNRALGQRVLEELRQMALAQRTPSMPAGPPPGAAPPGLPQNPPANPPSKKRRAAQPGPVDRESQMLARQFLDTLKDRDLAARMSIAALQGLYDNVVERTGRVRDAGDLTRALIGELTRRQRMSQPISYYEKQLKNDPDCLPALYFLMAANLWRASKGVNANSYRRTSQELRDHLRTLAPAADIKD